MLLQRYLSHVEFLFSPELFIIGGGISKRADEYLPRLQLRTPIVPAELKMTPASSAPPSRSH